MAIDKPKIHTAIVLISMLVFFPVGIILLIIRFATHYKYNHLRAKDYGVVGHSFMILYGLILLITFASSTGSDDIIPMVVVFGIFLGLPGVIFYILGSTREKKMKNLYNMYYHLTTAQGIESVSRISELTGVSRRNVTQDLTYMIASHRLPDARFDPVAQVVTLGSRRATDPTSAATSTGRPNEATREQIILTEQAAASGLTAQSVTCTGCGSTSSVIPGRSRECEFCGSVLFVPA
ncbi:hypothetical protein [Cohnella herbarum]|uniref:Uncharacterized protein n=1 Tax=Cohnella herbarum TaxID=2728023 RepID=A0A7Z2VMJ9_9BACL|nr:hypothetical protein [Cohnella herbarum]QJD85705.1 hypothetical protein HH215_22635 [Cohnella herbarum]